MRAMLTVCRKELSDHFSSCRFVILFALVAMVSIITAYMAGMGLRENLEGLSRPRFVFLMLFSSTGALFSLVQFVAFFGPLVGLVLGFDAVNRERAQGTLVKLLSPPVFRASLLSGKFLAGVTTITVLIASIVLVVSGLGLVLLGIVPGAGEAGRLAAYLLLSVVYMAFWLGAAMLFSVLLRSIPTSALACGAFWIFLSFFVILGAGVTADALAPIGRSGDAPKAVYLKNARIRESVEACSPMSLYTRASAVLVDPMRNTTDPLVLMGPMERISVSRFQNPLPLGQSLLVVCPHLTALLGLTLVCFAASCGAFMRQEIR